MSGAVKSERRKKNEKRRERNEGVNEWKKRVGGVGAKGVQGWVRKVNSRTELEGEGREKE
jgi:hypothetical protein